VKNKIPQQLIIKKFAEGMNNCKINLNNRQIRYNKTVDFNIMTKVSMPGNKFSVMRQVLIYSDFMKINDLYLLFLVKKHNIAGFYYFPFKRGN